MFNVCPKCGEYRADKIIDDTGSNAICPMCGFAYSFVRLPLFVVTGASGVGKSTICVELSKILHEAITMESDILWREEFNKPEDDYRSYRDMWLRVCKNISQAGRPVVLCGSAIPSQFEECVERRYFTQIHYLALVCDDNNIRERLQKRPTWRDCGSDDFIQAHIQFNKWFKENADKEPNIELVDTSNISSTEAAEKVAAWIRGKM